MKIARVVLAVAAASVAGAVACSIYDASLLLPAPEIASEAGSDAATPIDAAMMVDGTVADPCMHAHVPPKPTTEDGSGDVDIVLAASFLRFLPNGTASVVHPSPPVSFDLDNVCTCPGPESCTPLMGQMHCDGDGGTDNSAGAVLSTFALIAPDKFGDDALNKNLVAGQTTVLIRLRSWNGGANDKQITAIIYSSNGLEGIQDGGVSPPKLDGTDRWTISSSSLLGGATVDGGKSCENNDQFCIPIYADPEAYVSNGTFVAHLDFPIATGSSVSTLVVKLTSTVITGPLIQGDGGIRIDEGQVAGRWSTSAFLTALSTVHDPLNKAQFLCGDSGTYQNIKTLACRGSDVTANASLDGTGASCDALSIGLSFASAPAHLGAIYDTPPPTTTCGAAYKDDCNGVK